MMIEIPAKKHTIANVLKLDFVVFGNIKKFLIALHCKKSSPKLKLFGPLIYNFVLFDNWQKVSQSGHHQPAPFQILNVNNS